MYIFNFLFPFVSYSFKAIKLLGYVATPISGIVMYHNKYSEVSYQKDVLERETKLRSQELSQEAIKELVDKQSYVNFTETLAAPLAFMKLCSVAETQLYVPVFAIPTYCLDKVGGLARRWNLDNNYCYKQFYHAMVNKSELNKAVTTIDCYMDKKDTFGPNGIEKHYGDSAYGVNDRANYNLLLAEQRMLRDCNKFYDPNGGGRTIDLKSYGFKEESIANMDEFCKTLRYTDLDLGRAKDLCSKLSNSGFNTIFEEEGCFGANGERVSEKLSNSTGFNNNKRPAVVKEAPVVPDIRGAGVKGIGNSEKMQDAVGLKQEQTETETAKINVSSSEVKSFDLGSPDNDNAEQHSGFGFDCITNKLGGFCGAAFEYCSGKVGEAVEYFFS